MLDVRKPIGYLFTLIGAILAVYGAMLPQITTLEIVATHQVRTFNLDLPWGIVMLVFGALMLSLARIDADKKAGRNPATAAPEQDGEGS